MGAVIFILFVACAALFGWMAIRSQRELRRRSVLQADVRTGDEIMTTAGIYGRVQQLDADHAWIEIAPGTTIKLARRAIAAKVEAGTPIDERPDGRGAST
jgi:preprotein translocase subunit YajC